MLKNEKENALTNAKTLCEGPACLPIFDHGIFMNSCNYNVLIYNVSEYFCRNTHMFLVVHDPFMPAEAKKGWAFLKIFLFQKIFERDMLVALILTLLKTCLKTFQEFIAKLFPRVSPIQTIFREHFMSINGLKYYYVSLIQTIFKEHFKSINGLKHYYEQVLISEILFHYGPVVTPLTHNSNSSSQAQ